MFFSKKKLLFLEFHKVNFVSRTKAYF